MSQSPQDPPNNSRPPLIPRKVLLGGYPLSQQTIREWGERNVPIEEAGETALEQMNMYYGSIKLWANNTFGRSGFVMAHGEGLDTLEYKYMLVTQTGTWNSGHRDIDPIYIPRFMERPRDGAIKALAEQHLGEFDASLIHLIAFCTQTPSGVTLQWDTVLT